MPRFRVDVFLSTRYIEKTLRHGFLLLWCHNLTCSKLDFFLTNSKTHGIELHSNAINNGTMWKELLIHTHFGRWMYNITYYSTSLQYLCSYGEARGLFFKDCCCIILYKSLRCCCWGCFVTAAAWSWNCCYYLLLVLICVVVIVVVVATVIVVVVVVVLSVDDGRYILESGPQVPQQVRPPAHVHRPQLLQQQFR